MSVIDTVLFPLGLSLLLVLAWVIQFLVCFVFGCAMIRMEAGDFDCD